MAKTDNQKLARLRTIIKILNGKNIASQAELMDELETEGFQCTQATLSRDLTHLKVTKDRGVEGQRVYVLPAEIQTGNGVTTYRRQVTSGILTPIDSVGMRKDGFLSIHFSGNIAVIKTRPGFAPSIAFHIDECQLPEVIGTIAGDDTIMCVVKENIPRHIIDKALKDALT